MTYIRVVPQLLNRNVVEVAGIAVEFTDLILLLNTSSVSTAHAALVNRINPAQVRVDIACGDTWLEGDDELSGYVRRRLITSSRRSGPERDDGGDDSRYVLEVDHRGNSTLW